MCLPQVAMGAEIVGCRTVEHCDIMLRQIKVDQVLERLMCLPQVARGAEVVGCRYTVVQSSIATWTNALDCTAYHLPQC